MRFCVERSSAASLFAEITKRCQARDGCFRSPNGRRLFQDHVGIRAAEPQDVTPARRGRIAFSRTAIPIGFQQPESDLFRMPESGC